MTCDAVERLIPLYFYGELEPEEEERMEQHLAGCLACARQMDRQRDLGAVLNARAEALPPRLLEDCRADLMAAVDKAPPLPKSPKGPWAFFLDALGTTFGSVQHVPQPVGALALVALGFFAARFTGAWPAVPGAVSTSGIAPSADVFATVRSVQPGDAGRVQIAFDETRRRVISGRMDDQAIQKLLLAAAQEENASVRVESVDLLRSRSGSTEVRDALLNRVATDPNDGVRLKALEGLMPLAGDPDVRRALAQVLRTDPNPAMRMQAVDLLAAHRDDSVIGVLQGMVQREDDRTVRLKLEKALKDMNASIGTF